MAHLQAHSARFAPRRSRCVRKDVLSPEEFQTLLGELSVRDRAMVLLAGSTGPRRPEMIALSWADVNVLTLELTRFHRRLVFHRG